jgi:hypothetical protein
MRFANQTFFGSGFGTFQAPDIDHLYDRGATEYTLSGIVLDRSGSVQIFAAQLRQMLIEAATATKSSPRSENVLLRAVYFNDSNITEIHGFVPASEINPQDYPHFSPNGGTPLYKATFNGVSSIVEYGKTLASKQFLVNGILFIITDGEDTERGVSPAEIALKIAEVKSIKGFDSLTTILIGLTKPRPDGEYESDGDREQRARIVQALESFKREAGITHFVDMGNANAATLAKLANFVSSSLIIKSKKIGTTGDTDDMSDDLKAFHDEAVI